MSLSDYLAQKYLTADPLPSSRTKPSSKKRKRKDTPLSIPQTNLIISNDDDSDILHRSRRNINSDDSDNDDPTTLLLHNSKATTADFRKSKKSSWKTVGEPAPSHADQAAADAIIASAAAENASRAGGVMDDEAPQIVSAITQDQDDGGDNNNNKNAQIMSSGARAGLQTAAQVNAAVSARRAQELFNAQSTNTTAKEEDPTSAQALTHETIYRDASGRIINIASKRAAARRAAQDAALLEKQRANDTAGDVQLREAERKKELLRDAKYMPFARGADDSELNEELKEVSRWNDPAAEFLTQKKNTAAAGGGKTGGGGRGGRQVYKGAAPPNRHGIRPGWRWDGVDRGNGFEGQWFAARNKKESRRDLEFAWQMDE